MKKKRGLTFIGTHKLNLSTISNQPSDLFYAFKSEIWSDFFFPE